MIIRSCIASVIICSIVALTGCASKEVVKMDSGSAATLSPSTSEPKEGIPEKIDQGQIAGAVIPEHIPTASDAAEPINDPRSEFHLDPVYFDFDSYLLRADARDTLSRNARWLADNRITRVTIEGHADERGSDEYNMALAEKRALAARRYVETLGVSPERLETISYGEDKPAVIGHDEDAWSKNRRVEFVISK
ncbi:peptidoglycan-associated lipoprotein Pal [Geomobilimonas luticola]|uniref:Peptidoglycan-associated lipoprotein n=1 Tax=Geomobilimonas luticola TaxID=1114878 RepID=A0ABS5S9G4_9BACT|nr:peptidoglycan-associated lipoprotein Pal [Geomobilimonas luticola]MBT0652013.1 peptidoglycan-associated lipoprotein Pal [Geomobilimonas luticola]